MRACPAQPPPDAKKPARGRVGGSCRTAAEWWVLTGSNRRHPACKASALPTELTTQILERVKRFELSTFTLAR